MAFYTFNKPLKGRSRLLYELGGFLFILLLWILVTIGDRALIPAGILPSPIKVFNAFFELLYQNKLVPNFFYSLGLNLGGYIEAIVIAVPLAFFLGLVPQLRSSFQRPVDSVRFLVLPAAVGLFIAWFGIGSWMKIHFLSFGIIIYLLPTAIQRIDEVNEVYLKTVYTLGASPWQMIKTVYFPSVISKLISDIRILTAISWTYIVIAESIGGDGGIGALTWQVGLRRGRIDKVFCLLIIIMLVGIVQDKIFGHLDRKLFPYKIQSASSSLLTENKLLRSLGETIMDYCMNTLSWAFVIIYAIFIFDEYLGLIGNFHILTYLFRDTVWVFHLVFLSVLIYKFKKLKRLLKYNLPSISNHG